VLDSRAAETLGFRNQRAALDEGICSPWQRVAGSLLTFPFRKVK
jgi:hypothetical protein